MNSESQTSNTAIINELKGQELNDLMINNGILQEANRSFFNPLGLNLEIENGNVVIFKTDDPKGFLMDHINKFQLEVFRKYSQKKHQDRGNLMGFIIQVYDLFRASSVLKNGLGLALSASNLKINLIFTVLNGFTQAMYKKIMEKHKYKDSNFDPNQFEKGLLLDKLYSHIDQENWINVANYAAMLYKSDMLKQKVMEIKNRPSTEQEN